MPAHKAVLLARCRQFVAAIPDFSSASQIAVPEGVCTSDKDLLTALTFVYGPLGHPGWIDRWMGIGPASSRMRTHSGWPYLAA